jgi:cysteinyl-tRNA synthetase
LAQAQDLLRELAGVFGLRLDQPARQYASAAPFIELLIELRRELRSQKLYSLADHLRNRLVELGVILEDTRDGTEWRFSNTRDRG